jgi:hypothetical protein
MTENISQTIFWTCHAFHSNSLQNSSKVLCKRIRVTQKENQIHVLTEGTSWNWCSIQKWLRLVAVQRGMSSSIINVATKFWELWPYKSCTAHGPLHSDSGARISYGRWLESVFQGLMGTQLKFHCNEVWFKKCR